MRGDHGEEGAATVWTLGLAVVLVAITYAVLLVCVAVGARHHAEAAADLAALAAAGAVQTGTDACAAAARVAAANTTRVRRCLVLADRSVIVDVQLEVPRALARWAPATIIARARAGS